MKHYAASPGWDPAYSDMQGIRWAIETSGDSLRSIATQRRELDRRAANEIIFRDACRAALKTKGRKGKNVPER